MRMWTIAGLTLLGALTGCGPAPETRAMSLCELMARGEAMQGQRVRLTATFRGDPRGYSTLSDPNCPGRTLAFSGFAGVAGGEVGKDWLADIEESRVVSSADALSNDFRVELTGAYLAKPLPTSPKGSFQAVELHRVERLPMSAAERAVYRELEGAAGSGSTGGVMIPKPNR